MSRQKLLFTVSVKPLVTKTLIAPMLSQLRLIWVMVGNPSLLPHSQQVSHMFQNYSDIAGHIHVSIHVTGLKQHQKHKQKDKAEISNTGKIFITRFKYLGG